MFPGRAPGDRGIDDESLPPINIFAPPPADPPEGTDGDGRGAAFGEPSRPQASPQPLSDLADDGAEIDDDEGSEDAGDWRDRTGARAHGAGDLDPASDSGSDPRAGSRVQPEASAENRLAALITRYQSGLHAQPAREAEPEVGVEALPVAELAERFGATEVDDLLTVSAAWLTLVARRPKFMRREVMEVFETLPGDHPRTLEARIKGFGSLIRSGTLELVDDGAFTLSPRARARFLAAIDQG